MTSKQRWTLIAAILGSGIVFLDSTVVNVALPKIGREFGGRDHTTVIHATSKIARLIREDRSVYNLVQELTARVKQVR